jgi:hypothetical protein
MTWLAVDLDPADPNNWGEYTQAAPAGNYEAKVVVRFVEINNPNNTENKETIVGNFTVRPAP